MGAGKGATRRAQSQASPATIIESGLVHYRVLETMDKMVADSHGQIKWSAETIAEKMGPMFKAREVAKDLKVLEKRGVVARSRGNSRRETLYSLTLKNPLQEQHDFGSGEVMAHQHPNGGGWVAETADVDPLAYVGVDAKVWGAATVGSHTVVADHAEIGGSATLMNAAVLRGTASVTGNVEVSGAAVVSGVAVIYGDAKITGNARVDGKAQVRGQSFVGANAEVGDGAIVEGNAKLKGHAVIKDTACINGNALLEDNAILSGHCLVGGGAIICGTAVIGDKAQVSGGYRMDSGFLGGDEVVDSYRLIRADEHGIRVESDDLKPLSF